MSEASPHKMAYVESQLEYEKKLRSAAEAYARGLEGQLEEIMSSGAVKEKAEGTEEVTPDVLYVGVSRGTKSSRPRSSAKKKKATRKAGPGVTHGGVTKSGTPDRRTKAGRAEWERQQKAREERIEKEKGSMTTEPSQFSAKARQAREFAV